MRAKRVHLPLRRSLFSIVVGNESVVLYRSTDDGLHDATSAFRGAGACEFDRVAERFVGSDCPERLTGFDTFWYNWSLNNPDTQLLN